MASPKLVSHFGDRAAIHDQVVYLSEAINRYGRLERSYFGGLNRAIGIEFEMESANGRWEHFYKRNLPLFWKHVQDGSLKKDGVELVSRPVCGHGIDYALHEVEMFLAPNKNLITNSVRTSIHVHCDVSDFETEELDHLVALYALFENLFFAVQGPFRQNNPYCYEITSLLPGSVEVDDQIKYCAFNIAPVRTQLSVEFRHADFRLDMRTNRRWIQLVAKFMHFAGKNRARLNEIVTNTIVNDDYLKLFLSLIHI